MASKTPVVPAGPVLDIQFDRASKFYEPGERVTGTACIAGQA